jgi:hypothetical protein
MLVCMHLYMLVYVVIHVCSMHIYMFGLMFIMVVCHHQKGGD